MVTETIRIKTKNRVSISIVLPLIWMIIPFGMNNRARYRDMNRSMKAVADSMRSPHSCLSARNSAMDADIWAFIPQTHSISLSTSCFKKEYSLSSSSNTPFSEASVNANDILCMASNATIPLGRTSGLEFDIRIARTDSISSSPTFPSGWIDFHFCICMRLIAVKKELKDISLSAYIPQQHLLRRVSSHTPVCSTESRYHPP